PRPAVKQRARIAEGREVDDNAPTADPFEPRDAFGIACGCRVITEELEFRWNAEPKSRSRDLVAVARGMARERIVVIEAASNLRNPPSVLDRSREDRNTVEAPAGRHHAAGAEPTF